MSVVFHAFCKLTLRRVPSRASTTGLTTPLLATSTPSGKSCSDRIVAIASTPAAMHATASSTASALNTRLFMTHDEFARQSHAVDVRVVHLFRFHRLRRELAFRN